MQSSEEQSSTRFSKNEKKVSMKILSFTTETRRHGEDLYKNPFLPAHSVGAGCDSVVKYNYAFPSTIASNAMRTYSPYSI